jgi:hypothetical protein
LATHRVCRIIAAMSKLNVEALATRLDVQAIVLQEMARVLKPEHAASVANAVRLTSVLHQGAR